MRQQGLDWNVNDLVQIKPKARRNAGRIGRIIGERLDPNKNNCAFVYTVKFSDNESAEYGSSDMTLIRKE